MLSDAYGIRWVYACLKFGRRPTAHGALTVYLASRTGWFGVIDINCT